MESTWQETRQRLADQEARQAGMRNAAEIDERAEEARTKWYTLKPRYIEVEAVEFLGVQGDCEIYQVRLRTDKPLDVRQADEALKRGFMPPPETPSRVLKRPGPSGRK